MLVVTKQISRGESLPHPDVFSRSCHFWPAGSKRVNVQLEVSGRVENATIWKALYKWMESSVTYFCRWLRGGLVLGPIQWRDFICSQWHQSKGRQHYWKAVSLNALFFYCHFLSVCLTSSKSEFFFSLWRQPLPTGDDNFWRCPHWSNSF